MSLTLAHCHQRLPAEAKVLSPTASSSLALLPISSARTNNLASNATSTTSGGATGGLNKASEIATVVASVLGVAGLVAGAVKFIQKRRKRPEGNGQSDTSDAPALSAATANRRSSEADHAKASEQRTGVDGKHSVSDTAGNNRSSEAGRAEHTKQASGGDNELGPGVSIEMNHFLVAKELGPGVSPGANACIGDISGNTSVATFHSTPESPG